MALIRFNCQLAPLAAPKPAADSMGKRPGSAKRQKTAALPIDETASMPGCERSAPGRAAIWAAAVAIRS